MSNVGATGGASPLNAGTGRTAPLGEKKAADPKAKMGTDSLAIAQGAKADFQYFGHSPRVTVTLMMKQPIWGDDRSDITSAQWAQMPAAQQKEILALIPTKGATDQFLSNMDPAVAEAKARVGAAVGKLWERAKVWSAEQDAKRAKEAAAAPRNEAQAQHQPAAQDPGAQVDRLNQLIEAGEAEPKT